MKEVLDRMFLLRISNQLDFKVTNWRNSWTLDEAVVQKLNLVSLDSFNPVCLSRR